MKKAQDYEEPEIKVIHLTEQDVITTSGDPFKDPFQDDEGEMV